MATIEKLPSGNWRITVYTTQDGKRQRHRKSGPDKAELKKWAANLEYQLSKGVDRAAVSQSRTLGDAMDEYIKNRTNTTAPHTIRDYMSYRRTAFPTIIGVRIVDITPAMVDEAINLSAKTHAPKSVKNYWELLNKVLRKELPDIRFEVKLPKQKGKKDIRIPTAAEAFRLLEATYGRPIEIPILLSITGGLRRGEIPAVDLYEDIDYEKSIVRVWDAMTQGYDDPTWFKKDPKTESGFREVELPTWVTERIREIRDSGEYHPMTADGISHSYIYWRNKLGIKNVRFQDLRHYYASILLAAGIPDKYAIKRMGHKTTDMLHRVYQHLIKEADEGFSDQVREAMEQFDITRNKATDPR